MQQSDESASLKQTVAKLQEEIATLRLERDDHLQQIEDLTNTVESQKSEMAISEAKMMHLESQLKGNIYGENSDAYNNRNGPERTGMHRNGPP